MIWGKINNPGTGSCQATWKHTYGRIWADNEVVFIACILFAKITSDFVKNSN